MSAKRPRRWGAVLDCEARLEREPVSDEDAPPVEIGLPDGTVATSERPDEAGARLSGALGRAVRLSAAAPETASYEYHWPDMEGLVHRGRTFRDEITEHRVLEGSFFDGSWLHLLTTATLAHLGALAAPSDFDARRFRPNLVIRTDVGRAGFVEDEWVGRSLRIGDAARLPILDRMFRCVMTTVAQGDLPKDPGVLRAAFDHNGGNVGVKAGVEAAGRIAVGDPVHLDG